ncbi:MAG: methyltransferase domain-containing protein [Acidisphaera sp.]|nr:methyltransferase domain-containing protein [Acidisphaera sp.]
MVSRSDVLAAYRIFLDREPEDEQVVTDYMSLASTEELFRAFIESDEFRGRSAPLSRPEDWPAMDVRLATTPDELQAMIDRVNRDWTRLGTDEPYWSVLSDARFRQEGIEETRDEFYRTGQADMERLFAYAARCGVDLAAHHACFELGCGVGRVTRWLAGRFAQVHAADISAAHLELARATLADAQVANVSLVHVTGLESLRAIRDYDLFFSILVLQHNPPPLMAHMLRAALTNLAVGGTGFFQLPTYHLGYAFDATAWLAASAAEDELEMHVLPQDAVMDIIYGSGCKVLEVREDALVGDVEGVSNTFLVQKRSAHGIA